MKKLLTILLLIGSALYAQTPITTNTLNLPKQTIRPAAPVTGAKLYDFFHRVEIRDSVGFTRIMTGRDTLYFIHTTDLAGLALKTTTISTTAPLTGGGDLSANRTFAIPKSTRTVDGYLAAVDFALFNKHGGYLQLGSDSTLNALYPLNISSLRLAPDSRYIPFNLPNVSSLYGDTLSIGAVISGRKIIDVWVISDGAGGIAGRGLTVDGSVKGGSFTGTSFTDGVATLTLGALRGATDVIASDSIKAKNLYATDTVKADHFRITTGASNGYVLKTDANGNITPQQLTSSYKGTWNATTNTPTISDATGSIGDFYIVATGGDQDLGHGSVTFVQGGTAVHNGTQYQAVNPANLVTSVNSLQGNVQLDLSLSGDTLMIVGGTDSLNLALIPALVLVRGRLAAIENDTTNYKTAYSHSQITGNPHGTTKSDVGLSNVVNEAPAYFAHEMTTDGENNIAVSFTISQTSKVYYNGSMIENSRWTGAGSTTIALTLDTRKHDYLVITN